MGNNFINGWGEFYQKYPGSGGAIELSAVGFNPEKTIAIVYLGLWYGNVAGSGGYYGMQKKDGKWVPLPWRVAYCDWIA